MDIVNPTKTLMEVIREEASRRIVKEGAYKGVNGFIEKLAHESLVVWLEYFPNICREMVRVNKAKMNVLKEVSSKGRFTESYGWSESRDFKFEYEYTPEFYFFMTNYVYYDFFSNENKKIYRRFMKKLFNGEDAIETLMWAKKIYGSNSQKQSVVNV